MDQRRSKVGQDQSAHYARKIWEMIESYFLTSCEALKDEQFDLEQF